MTATIVAGFFGKIAGRADFVAARLPRSSTDPWEAWVAEALAGSRAALAEAWVDVWLAAPVWRFALPAGMCGPDPLLGLWMPSVDKVGRYYPLMIAATTGRAPAARWLDAAEEAGRAAIAHDLSPDELGARIPPPPDLAATSDAGPPYGMRHRPGAGLWWTEGGPRVPAQALVLDTMPDRASFVAMLDAGHAAP